MFYDKERIKKYVQRNSYAQTEYFPKTITPKKKRNSTPKKTFTFKKMQPLLNSNIQKNNSKENSSIYIQDRIPKTSNDVIDSNVSKTNNESLIIATLSAEQLSQLESSRKLSYIENSQIKKKSFEGKKKIIEEKERDFDDSYFPNDLDNSFRHHNLVLKSFKKNLKSKLSQIQEEQTSYLSDETSILKKNKEIENKQKNNFNKNYNHLLKKNSLENYIKDNNYIAKKNKEGKIEKNHYKNINKNNGKKYWKVETRRSVENPIKKKSYEKLKQKKVIKKNNFLNKKFELKQNTPFELIKNLNSKKFTPKKEDDKFFNLRSNYDMINKKKKFSNLESYLPLINNIETVLENENEKETRTVTSIYYKNTDNLNQRKKNMIHNFITNKKEIPNLKSNYKKKLQISNSKNNELKSNSNKINYSSFKNICSSVMTKEFKSPAKIIDKSESILQKNKNSLNKNSINKKCYSLTKENQITIKSYNSPIKIKKFIRFQSDLKDKNYLKKNDNKFTKSYSNDLKRSSHASVRKNFSNYKVKNDPIKNDKQIIHRYFDKRNKNYIMNKNENSFRRVVDNSSYIKKDGNSDLKKFSTSLKKIFIKNNKKESLKFLKNNPIQKVIFDKDKSRSNYSKFIPSSRSNTPKSENFQNLEKSRKYQNLIKKDTNNYKSEKTSDMRESKNYNLYGLNIIQKTNSKISNNNNSTLRSISPLNIQRTYNNKNNKSIIRTSSIRKISPLPVIGLYNNMSRNISQNSVIKNFNPSRTFEKDLNRSKTMIKNSNINNIVSNSKSIRRIYKNNKNSKNQSRSNISPKPIKRIYNNNNTNNINRSKYLSPNSSIKNISPKPIKKIKKVYNNNKNINRSRSITQNSSIRNISLKPIKKVSNNNINRSRYLSPNSSIKNISPKPIKKVYNNNINRSRSISQNSSIRNLSSKQKSRIYKKNIGSVSQNSKLSRTPIKKNYNNYDNKIYRPNNNNIRNTAYLSIKKNYIKNDDINFSDLKNTTHLPSKKIYHYNSKNNNKSISRNSLTNDLEKNNDDLGFKKKVTTISKSPYSLKKSVLQPKFSYGNKYFSHIKKKMNKKKIENEKDQLLTNNNFLKYIDKENKIQKNLSKIYFSKKQKSKNFFNDKVFSQTFENLVRKKTKKKENFENKVNPYQSILNNMNKDKDITNFENFILKEKKNFNNNHNLIINSNFHSLKNRERIQKKNEYCYY